MDSPPRPILLELIVKTALAYAFFSLVVQTAAVDVDLIARGLVVPSFNPTVLAALLPHPGLGLAADLAIGALLGAVLYRLRNRVFHQKNGILVGFAILALVSLLITAGPALGMRLALGGVLRTAAVSLARDLLTIVGVTIWVH